MKLGLKGLVYVVQDQIAQALIEQAGHKGLIVVGSRGLDAIDRLVLRSVSITVTLHASCPVLIVKEPSPNHSTDARCDRRLSVIQECAPVHDKQFTAMPDAKPLVILLVHVMPFLRYTMVKEAGSNCSRRRQSNLKKSGTASGSFPVWGQLLRRS
ncbi:MAG: universal stress protein [Nitrospira sp.]